MTGRDFDGRDRTSAARTVIVNDAFARRFERATHRGSPLGAPASGDNSRATDRDPWFEIVGVVRDLGLNPEDRGPCCEEAPFIYHAAAAATIPSYVMSVHLRGDAATLSARLPGIAAAVNAGLRVEEGRPLTEWIQRRNQANGILLTAQAAVTVLALFLSALGIDPLMSVSVTRRTREIGLRTALGARPRDVLVGVIRRAGALMGSGIAAGGGVLLILAVGGGDEFISLIGRWTAITSTVMVLAGIAACLGPARRALQTSH